MSIIVQKYGGTSVGSAERMRHVADLVISERNRGHQVVVVASAMAGTTNQLVKSATQFPNALGTQAYDFVVSTGENISCGMLALALAEKGIKAVPLAGWQLPILTNELRSRARILDIQTAKINTLINKDVVPIITGFQGLGPDQSITTLGRGGSDTSAVAIAAALKAERCDIYTDIDGIYTADPRLVTDARFIEIIPSTMAFLMATLGTKIIHPRAVESAIQSNVQLRILSSFGSDKFTILNNHSHKLDIKGIAHLRDTVLVQVSILNMKMGQDIIDTLDHLDIPIDMIALSESNLEFCIESLDKDLVLATIPNHTHAAISQNHSKVSMVGTNMKAWAEQSINALQSSSISVNHSYIDDVRISVLVPTNQMENTVNTLHKVFFSA
jgi:aspartate kinase